VHHFIRRDKDGYSHYGLDPEMQHAACPAFAPRAIACRSKAGALLRVFK